MNLPTCALIGADLDKLEETALTLAADGFRPRVFSRLEDLLRLTQPPDLMVVVLGPAQLREFRLLFEMKFRYPGLQLVFFAPSYSEVEGAEALLLGASGYLPLPDSGAALGRAILRRASRPSLPTTNTEFHERMATTNPRPY